MEKEAEELEFEDATFEQQRAMILEGIARSEQDVADGRVISNEEAKRRLS